MRTLKIIFPWFEWDFWLPQYKPLLFCRLLQCGTIILRWQNIKTSNLCQNLPLSKTASLRQNADGPQPTKIFPKQKIVSRTAWSCVCRTAIKGNTTDTRLDRFITTWYTTHFLCNSWGLLRKNIQIKRSSMCVKTLLTPVVSVWYCNNQRSFTCKIIDVRKRHHIGYGAYQVGICLV